MPESGSMRAAAFALAAVAVLISAESFAACDKPAVPACAAGKGTFASTADFDRCRNEMLDYKGAMEKHAACSKEAGQPLDEQSSKKELEATLAQFNRRARGE